MRGRELQAGRVLTRTTQVTGARLPGQRALRPVLELADSTEFLRRRQRGAGPLGLGGTWGRRGASSPLHPICFAGLRVADSREERKKRKRGKSQQTKPTIKGNLLSRWNSLPRRSK